MNSSRDNIKVFSFDIFDTTVTRFVADPRDVFRLMQKTLSHEAFNDFPDHLRRDFASLRFKASLHARLEGLSRGKQEIGIADIYQKLHSFCPLEEKQSHQLMEMEFQQELACIYPVAWTVNEINNLRKLNKKIVFTSDMYLPLDVIEKILIKANVYIPSEDHVYLSNQLGLTKLSGKMFKHIMENEQCQASQLSHYGDDLHSDVYVPSTMGIRHYLLDDVERQKVLRFHHLKRIRDYFNKLRF